MGGLGHAQDVETPLIGLAVERLELSRGSTALVLEGECDGELVAYKAGTQYDVCCRRQSLFQADISNNPTELASLWNCLGQKVLGIKISTDHRVLEIELTDAKSVFVWSDGPPSDNLLVVHNEYGDDWFVAG